jgi:glycosyltransferase involved in cell wall biosynthesis
MTRPRDRIAAVVVSLPERVELLHQALDSIAAQTRPPDDLVVGVDWARRGEVWNQNRLLAATDAEWVAFLHDDDLWYPEHLASAEKHFETADVIVSDFDSTGRTWDIPKHWDRWDLLLRTNWFPPSAVVARRTVVDRWHEPDQPPPYDWVDWANWRRLYTIGARFAYTGAVTMDYRFGVWGNGSWQPQTS